MRASDYWVMTNSTEVKSYYDMYVLINKYSKPPSFKSFIEYCVSHRATVKRKKLRRMI